MCKPNSLLAKTTSVGDLKKTEKKLQELLTKLKHDRTLARRELNAVLDPVARLPLEISSEIFLSCLATSGTRFPQPGALHLPMLLLNVCAAWSRIAVSTPSLWAGIRILFQDGPQSLQKLVPRWLARAGNRPLSLSLSGYATFDSKVLRIVWSRARQLKHLELCEVEPERRSPRQCKLEREQRLGGWTMNLWEGGTDPGSLLALETLAVRGLEGSPRASRFPSRQILELLRLAPNLIDCLFRDVWVEFPPRGDKRARLVLPKLRRLVFGESNWSRDVLSHLNLPAIETLAADVHSASAELLPFLEASSPPLRELLLAEAGEFRQLARCLRLVPGLRRLDLCAAQFDLAAELFAALAESRSAPSLLPQLSMLAIHFAAHADLSAIHGFFWPAALRALTARRTHLQVLYLDIAERPLASQMPAPDIIVGFRELVADGMQVCLH
ncbi:hypothetical protein DFH08DRAFT_978212 [Mycena albidolilacea]|uniref:F-box domain-containing protein n=1 Tax=Mycena albidolilacea TaxID=1033008 RepID=A0AAD7E8E9_9AGAR|nr:hypothetical protein DFH08DRAFT_978212 [Mycena albidolilacea]